MKKILLVLMCVLAVFTSCVSKSDYEYAEDQAAYWESEYENKCVEYENLRRKYNQLVDEYNDLLSEAQEKEDIIKAIKTVYDPEIPVNIWDLGLIYGVDINVDEVVITMTFTSPTCPMMEELLQQVKDVVQVAVGDTPVRVELVWDPPWDLTRMSDEARVQLDLTEQGW
jgi:metal-sulfur cluster biosynthetic enzyme